MFIVQEENKTSLENLSHHIEYGGLVYFNEHVATYLPYTILCSVGVCMGVIGNYCIYCIFLFYCVFFNKTIYIYFI